MSDLRSLTVLLDHAERQRDQARAEHLRMQRAADAAAAQSEQLLAYRRDYEQRWNSRFQRQGDIEILRCYHQFMEKLSLAAEHQARVVSHALRQTEHAGEQLRATELRCASVRKLIERRRQEMRLGEERRDQKQTDEEAMRAAWAQRDSRPVPH